MDNSICIAIITIIGTLAGVLLGNWLQSRNTKQQRKWMLDDQKREWIRRKKQEDYTLILEFINSTLANILHAQDELTSQTIEKRGDLLIKYKEKIANAMPVTIKTMREDKELADMLVKFEKKKNGAFDAFAKNDPTRLNDVINSISGLGGSIKQHLDESLEKTFD